MVASAIGAVIGGATSLMAANRQAKAAKRAAALQQQQYEQSRADTAPWRKAGANALAQLAALYGLSGEDARQRAMASYQTAPGYQLRFVEGQRALDRSAAARGALMSGNQLRALTEYGQTLAAQDFGAYANQLANLAGMGQLATAGTANLAASAVGRTADYMLQAANARSARPAAIRSAIAPAIKKAFSEQPKAASVSPPSNGLVGYYPGDSFT